MAESSSQLAAPTLRSLSSSLPPRRVVLRDFIWTLIRTDFKVRYHGAVGGFLWALGKPLVIFTVLYTVFRFLFPASGYRDSLLMGILLWTFFSEATHSGLMALARKNFLVTKAKFPLWILVVTAMANATLTLIVYAIAIIVVVSMSHGVPSLGALCLFVVYLAAYCIIVFGFSLGACVLYPRFRDLDQIWDVILQAGFFLAPIMYPISTLPERYQYYLYLWPVTPILQFTRAVLLEGSFPTHKAHLELAVMTTSILVAGVLVFRRGLQRAVEAL